jgi:hypothetical protein
MLDAIRPSGWGEDPAENCRVREGKRTLFQTEDAILSKAKALVYVVDDEAEVREAVGSLLRQRD